MLLTCCVLSLNFSSHGTTQTPKSFFSTIHQFDCECFPGKRFPPLLWAYARAVVCFCTPLTFAVFHAVQFLLLVA